MSRLDLRLVLGAVPGPGNGLESFLVDRLLVYEAPTVRAVGDSVQRETYLVKNAGVRFVRGEYERFLLVLYAVVADIARRAVADRLLLSS